MVNQLETNVFDHLPLLLAVPALQPSWASAAQPHIDSQRRASCRCAGSAAASTSSTPSFESWSHHERIRLSHPLSAVGQNRLDFVRPGTVAGQISLVGVMVGKVRTRLRDSPDGTRVRETIPGIHRRITRWEHPLVYGVRAIRTADGPNECFGCAL
jgi:hypothetical protein